VILFGFEAHITILQTCFDLLEHGYRLHLVIDAITSKNKIDRSIALKRMQNEGAFIWTSESLVFNFLKDAKHNSFKDCLAIMKTQRTNCLDLT